MLSRKIIRSILVLFFAGFGFSAVADTWQKIDVAPGIYQATDGNGAARDIAPSCSGGPVCAFDPATGLPNCRPGNTQFSFYYKAGKKKDKLLVYFDGGGACWDSNSCVTGPVFGVNAYVQELSPNFSTQGLFDTNNTRNPYRDWNIVAIPYCTGDIHLGSKDQVYLDFTGAVTGAPFSPVVIHHRGFDNYLYVQEWLRQRFTGERKVEDLLVTGSSAGGYGASFAYPHLKATFPRAKGYMMGDASNGVVSDALFQQALRQPQANWGANENLVHAIPGMDGVFDLPPDYFSIAFYTALGHYYPKDRFSQYTTQFDAVQVLFYNISLNQNDIASWFNIFPVYEDWTRKMLNSVYATSAVNPNYRRYVAAGCNHTVLRFDDDFYNTSSGQSPSFLSWFRALTQEGEDGAYPSKWVNSMCADCRPPANEQEVGVCLQRTIGPQ